MYYIYKIENKVNHKKYIGLTNNVIRRRNRHFSDLRRNRHDNSFLQKEFNIYGIDNFSFEVVFSGDVNYQEISDKEVEYIAYYDSYYNGYNQNKGGNFGPSNGGSHLTESDILSICAALEFCSRPGAVLAKIFDITTTTVSRIKKKMSHMEIIEKYDHMSEEERREIYNIFVQSCNFEWKKAHQTVLNTKRKLSREQVYLIYLNDELKKIKIKPYCRFLNVASNVIYGILRKETYKDYWQDYQNITQAEKDRLVSLLSDQQKQII